MKEKEILKEAKKLFSKYGFKKVSMDEIAKNAGVTKKTVYANFASKEELLNSLIKLELQDMKERFEKMEKESDNFFEGINKGLITLLIFRKRNNLFKTLFEEAEILRNKSLVNSIRYIEQDVIDYIKRKLEKAEQDGYIAFDNIDVLTFLMELKEREGKMIKKIKGNRYLKIIIFLVVLLIPFIYSFFYLKSYWNPYGNLSEIKVGVVNLDKTEGSKGIEFVKQLKDSKTFDFTEVTNIDDAIKGLGNDDFYALITIPSNFTEKLNSVTSKEKKISTITYSPNKRKNYLSSQIINSALKNVEMKLEEKVSKEVTKTLSDNLKKVPENLKQISEGADKLNSGVSELSNGLNTLNAGTSELNNKYSEFNNGIASAANGITELNKGTNTLNTGIATLSEGVNKYTIGVETLANNTITYIDGSSKVIGSIDKYVDGVNNININKNKLLNKIISISGSNPGLVPLANQAKAIMNAENAAKLTQNGNALKVRSK